MHDRKRNHHVPRCTLIANLSHNESCKISCESKPCSVRKNISEYFTSCICSCTQSHAILQAMPHGSEKSREKNHNEIRHSLCMPHGRGKIVANYEENDT